MLQLSLIGKLQALREHLKPQLEALSDKREKVEKLLIKHEFSFLSGSSTFYYFINVSKSIRNTKHFATDLLERRHVSIIPGAAYGSSTEGFIRLSFAVEPLGRIEQGLMIIREELQNAKS